MKLKWSELDKFRRAERCGESPTNRLLQEWGQQNHTVLDLFFCLWQMDHFQAMRALQPCVPVEYHKLLTNAERRIAGISTEERRSLVQESQRPTEATTNHQTLYTDASVRPGYSGLAVGVSPKPTTQRSDVKSTTSISHQSSKPQTSPGYPSNKQNPLQPDDGREGACALDPSHYHNLHVPDPKPSNPCYDPASSKVPAALLCSTPAKYTPPTHVPTDDDSSVIAPTKLANRRAMQNKKISSFSTYQETDRKMRNNEVLGACPEVSCEDNNPEELKTKVKNVPYDPDQDYLAKVEEKRAKEAAREGRERKRSAMAAAASGPTSSSGNISVTLKQEGSTLHPASPPQAPQSVYHQPSTSRKISNVSDAESPYSSVPVIPYKELEEATALWSHHNLLGRGGFGAVFKGTWKNTEVAIKRIEPHGNASLDNTRLHITQSLEELKLLQCYRHDNILQVYGYSTDHELYPCLVYQFMPHGSVEDRLQCRKIEAFGEGLPLRRPESLGWRQRFRVAWGTAGALQFLHTVKEKPLIHGDVKSANILLDQNYEPKLGDFGLAREGKSQSTSMQVSRVHGTKPYLPDDYLRNKKLSVKVDTYSFGIVLFELCTGLRAYDEKRKEGQKFLRELVEETTDQEVLRDKKAAGTQEQEVFTFLYRLGKDCVNQRASQRPDMTIVYKELDSYRIVMEERARARRISMGESSSGCSTPHLLQVRYDTAGSLLSPSTVPSYPHFFHPPSSPSAASTLPPPQSPGLSRFPVPSGSPHYFPHSPLRPTYPGVVVNGQVNYHPRMYPPGGPPRWMQGPAENMMCGLAPHSSNVPNYYFHHINVPPGVGGPGEQQDPPSYSETMSREPSGGIVAGAQAIIPHLSGLNMTSDSETTTSDLGDSESGLSENTTHYMVPTVLPQYQTPSGEGMAGPVTPFLTELGIKSNSSAA